ncbi:MAG: glucosamine-6-phosphate deaminase, partial [Candidatus Hydrothermae bacterium]|nr:glucosamine-6-phosphate deaminase [Candidatus Hydrothermae bacterium]
MTRSHVEQTFLAWSGQPLRYDPVERIGVLVVDHFPLLGKLTALRCLEWVQEHPEGVIALPTGKTPEYFIRWVQHYLGTWSDPGTREDLARHGLDPARKPDMRGLRFVQIDEFYPIDPVQTNSFYHYIQRFYIQGFGLDPDRALLIDARAMGLPEGMALQEVWPEGHVDLSLRYRAPRSALERLQQRVIEAVDEWCQRYEEQIRAWGGLGFFLGGIGPDGHIAFNVRGSDHHSTTRLTDTNYETQAAAAVDLGGIETARGHKVITIGLGTITFNPDTVAIIFAAGEAKARVVREAVEEAPHVRYPGTALQKLPHARFYLTRGAASLLTARRLAALKRSAPDEETVDRILIDVALPRRKPLTSLTEEDLDQDPLGRALRPHLSSPLSERLTVLQRRLRDRLERGLTTRSRTVFLHTAPHHDDILLGYLPLAVRHIRDASNQHHFAYLTSGFTAVTNTYARDLLLKLRSFLERNTFDRLWAEGYFAPGNRLGRNRDVWQYLDGVAAQDLWMMAEGEARRMLRNLVELYALGSLEAVQQRIRELVDYFELTY